MIALPPTRSTDANNASPFFLPLALGVWMLLMLASIMLPSVPAPAAHMAGSAFLLLALAFRLRGLHTSLALKLILALVLLAPLCVFLLAFGLMGSISSLMIYGLLTLLVALPVDACLAQLQTKRNGRQA